MFSDNLQPVLTRLDLGWRLYFQGEAGRKTYFDTYKLLPDTLILELSTDHSIHTCLGELVSFDGDRVIFKRKDSLWNDEIVFYWERL